MKIEAKEAKQLTESANKNYEDPLLKYPDCKNVLESCYASIEKRAKMDFNRAFVTIFPSEFDGSPGMKKSSFAHALTTLKSMDTGLKDMIIILGSAGKLKEI